MSEPNYGLAAAVALGSTAVIAGALWAMTAAVTAFGVAGGMAVFLLMFFVGIFTLVSGLMAENAKMSDASGPALTPPE